MTVDLTRVGRTYVGTFNVQPGPVREVWLVIRDATVLSNGLTRPLHASWNCSDLAGSGGPADSGDDEPDGEPGIIRLVASADDITVFSEAPTEIKAKLETARDIVHRHGNVVVFPPDIGKHNGGDLHGGRWSLGPSLPIAPVPAGEGSSLVPGQIVVRFKDGTPEATIQGAIAAKNLTVLRQWQPKHYFTLKAPNGASLPDILEFFHSLSVVEYVAPNTFVELNALDPEFSNQVQWPQVGLTELSDGRADPASGWATSVGTFLPVVAVIDDGVDLNNPDIFPNLFINAREIPRAVLVAVGDRNGDLVLSAHDLDFDNDGALTFADLDAVNGLTGGAACPAANSPPIDRCNPTDLVSGAGHQAEPGVVCPTGVLPVTGYGWEDGIDTDCNGFVDDVVGWNFNQDSNLVSNVGQAPFDGHGTTVAGIIGAVGSNGVGIAGMNWRVRLVSIQPLQTDPSPLNRTTRLFRDSAYSAFQYAAGLNAAVVNASFGCYVFRQGAPPAASGQCGEYNLPADKYAAFTGELRKELADVQASLAGAVLVFSAGNSGANHDDPGVFVWPSSMSGPNVLRVASVGAAGHPNADMLSEFSDFGGIGTDIAAPGEFFVELKATGPTTTCPSSDLASGTIGYYPGTGCSGTSFSSPMVAGTAALLIAADTALVSNSCRVADRILRNADIGVGDLGPKVGFLGRRLNAKRALENNVIAPVRICP